MTISNNKRRGFTLTELLVVIIIMGVIAALVVMAAKGARKKANYDGARAGVQFIAAKIDSYYNKRGQLPSDLNNDGVTTEMEIYQTLKEWGFEVPPKNQVDPWGNPYVIILQGDYVDGTTTPPQPPIAKPFDLDGNTMGYDIQDIAGKSYLNVALANMKNLYVPKVFAPTLQQKAIYRTDDPNKFYNGQPDGYQVISAGPDGKIFCDDNPIEPNRAAYLNYNADNITNW